MSHRPKTTPNYNIVYRSRTFCENRSSNFSRFKIFRKFALKCPTCVNFELLSLNFVRECTRERYPALGHLLPWAISFFFFKWEENKYFLPYGYCFIYKSNLLNPYFVKKNYFILVFLHRYFFDEQIKFLIL